MIRINFRINRLGLQQFLSLIILIRRIIDKNFVIHTFNSPSASCFMIFFDFLLLLTADFDEIIIVRLFAFTIFCNLRSVLFLYFEQ